MAKNVAINGFGRIGRAVFRIAAERSQKNFQIVAINDLTPIDNLAYLLRFDSTHGRFGQEVAAKGDKLIVNGQEIQVFAEKDPTKLPWGKLKVDTVVESTGVFTEKAKIAQHLTAGAKRVILSAPAKDKIDLTVVIGANEKLLNAKQQIIANASCSTNCAVPVCKVLDEEFGITSAHFTIVHSYTANQSLVDAPSKNWRRGRAGAINLIPTSTGAADAVTLVLPQLEGKINGIAVRVPVVDGSMFALSAVVAKKTTAEKVNAALKKAAAGSLKGILAYSEDELVSTDILHTTYSSIVDSAFTEVMGDNLVNVYAWFDNEWGYSNRIVDLLDLVCPL